jgi:hypothetical protein
MATWLLQRLTSGPEREALAGDLCEQYQRGRSAGWYDAQVLWAIVAGAVYDAGQHYLLAIRAVVIWYVLAWITADLAVNAYGLFGLWIWNWTVAHDWDVVGWIVARLHRRHVAAVMLTCTTAMVVYALTSPTRLWPIVFAQTPFLANIHYALAVFGAPVSFLIGGLLGSGSDDATLAAPEQEP